MKIKKKYKKILIILGFFFFFNFIIFFILIILRENISFFYTVTEAITLQNNQKLIRIGGMIVENSIIRKNENEIIFQITDFNKNIIIKYCGIMPPMFSEKNGVVVEGKILKNGIFLARTVLAKHDENYMPKIK